LDTPGPRTTGALSHPSSRCHRAGQARSHPRHDSGGGKPSPGRTPSC
jgi:hypothetical protein